MNRTVRPYFCAASLLFFLPLFGCKQQQGPAVRSEADTSTTLRFNQVYGINTHNSYWLNRSDQYDFDASGTQEILSDQLLHEHARGIELDIHSEGAPAHQWKVYHTSDSEDFTCRYLTDCLEYLRNFHYAVPHHEAIVVVVELKNVVTVAGTEATGPTKFNFDSTHTVSDLDALFTNTLGNLLYRPSDFASDNACDLSTTTLRDCARNGNWPTLERLRGKFIVALEGNWSTAAYDWAQYAGNYLESHAAFPMLSVLDYVSLFEGETCAAKAATITDGNSQFCLFYSSNGPLNYFPTPDIPNDLLQRGYDASIIWQVEDLSQTTSDQLTKPHLAQNIVVRAHDSFEYKPSCQTYSPGNCQDDRIAAGFQLIQTDYPWYFYNNTAWQINLPTDPSQRVRDPNGPPINEPGSRLYFQTDATYPGAFAFQSVSGPADRWWETTVSTTRNSDTWGIEMVSSLQLNDTNPKDHTCPGITDPEVEGNCTNYPRVAQEGGEGCVRASTDDGSSAIEICRQKNKGDGLANQERVDLYARVYKGGQLTEELPFHASMFAPCKSTEDPGYASNVSSICIGNMIAMGVRNAVDSSGNHIAQVAIYSAGKTLAGTPVKPDWKYLLSAQFDGWMTKQGYRGWKSQLFAGNRMADALVESDPYPGAVGFAPDPSRLHQVSLSDLGQDYSGDGRIADLSFTAGPVPAQTSPTLLPPANVYGWNNLKGGPVALTLSAPATLIDGGAAIRGIDYSISGTQNSGLQESPNNPTVLSFSSEGQDTVSFYAVDLDGTREVSQSTNVWIDNTPPSISTSVMPTPNANGWNGASRSPVTVSFPCNDSLSGISSIAGPSHYATSVTLASEGRNQSAVGTCVDKAINSATASTAVNIDLTPPVPTYAGGQSTYAVDQTVDITCSATDNLSGVAGFGATCLGSCVSNDGATCATPPSSTCNSISGPAYLFTVGENANNTYSLSAIDLADNCASTSVSFRVIVTYQALCNLVERFSTDAGAANSLCTKLFSAQASSNPKAKRGKFGGFENEVRAQATKAFSSKDAAILERLAMICENEC